MDEVGEYDEVAKQDYPVNQTCDQNFLIPNFLGTFFLSGVAKQIF